MYKCMVMSWSSGAKLTRRLASFMLLRRLLAFSLETGTIAASTVRPRFKTCNGQSCTDSSVLPCLRMGNNSMKCA